MTQRRQRRARQLAQEQAQRRNAAVPGAASIYDKPATSEPKPASLASLMSPRKDSVDEEDKSGTDKGGQPSTSLPYTLDGTLESPPSLIHDIPTGAIGDNVAPPLPRTPSITSQGTYEEAPSSYHTATTNKARLLNLQNTRSLTDSPWNVPKLQGNYGEDATQQLTSPTSLRVRDLQKTARPSASMVADPERLVIESVSGRLVRDVYGQLDPLFYRWMQNLPSPGVERWSIQVGTSILGSEATPQQTIHIYLHDLLQWLLRISPASTVIIRGLEYGRDAAYNHKVQSMNGALEQLIEKANRELYPPSDSPRVEFLGPDDVIASKTVLGWVV